MEEEFIRDVTKVGSIPKSEVRARLKAIVEHALSQQRKTIVKWCEKDKKEMLEINGECQDCGLDHYECDCQTYDYALDKVIRFLNQQYK